MDHSTLLLRADTRIWHPRTTINLWAQALQSLDNVDKQRISPNRADRRAVLDDLLKVVTEKQGIAVEKQWRYTKRNGEVVLIRDMFHSLVNWVKKFREVGDAVAQYDPAHMSLPWAGIRLILQLAINDGETYGAMLEGVELVSRFVAQYAKVEELYFHEVLAQQEQLEMSITELYTAILAYLSKATQYYDEGRTGRLAKSIVRGSSSVDKYIKAVVDKAAQVDRIACIIDADFTRKMAGFMYSGFQGFHDRFDALENKLGGLQLSLRTPLANANIGQDQILAWLNPVQTDEEYETALRLKTSGTCEWLFQCASFQEWMSPSYNAEDPHKTFWVHGPPGFGKTVLCASIIRRLQTDHLGRVAYFFCTSDDEAKRQPLAIVRSWVAQIVRQDSIALEAAEDLYRGKDGRPPTTHDIWQIFGEICRRTPDCFFIVDGFDECTKVSLNEKFLSHDAGDRFLQELGNALAKTSTHILIVSREDPDVRGHFRKLTDSFPSSVAEYEISPSDTEIDIQTYSTSILGQNLSKKSAALREELAEEASRCSQGMFLWVRLLSRRLNGNKNAKQLREIVKKTPAGLETQYERDMQHIESLGDERDRAIAILRWTLYARRPLTVRELTEALAIGLTDDNDTFPRDDLPDTWSEDEVNDDIRRLCGSLIELRSIEEGCLLQDQTVHFVHSSVREYLLQPAVSQNKNVTVVSFPDQDCEDDILAQICLRYLMCKEFRDHLCDAGSTPEKINEYKFLDYASRAWYVHARSSKRWSMDLSKLCNKFFEPSARRWTFWWRLFQAENAMKNKGLDIPSLDHDGISSLFVASFLGLENSVQCLLNQEIIPHVNEIDSTPLHAASVAGHFEVVKLLVEQDAEVNAKTKDDCSPLHLAAWNGHLEVAKLLVKQNAEVNAKTKDDCSPLHLAAWNGHLEVAKLLVEQDAEVNVKAKDDWSPLHFAARNGHLEVLKLLLELSTGSPHDSPSSTIIDCSGQDAFGLTPLLHSIYKRHDDIALILANHGADPSLHDGYGRNALDWISTNSLLSESLKGIYPSGQLTPSSQQRVLLQRTIVLIAQKLIHSKRRSEHPGFHQLGHCFVFLERFIDSVISFQQQVIEWNEVNDPLYDVTCDNCPRVQNIVGVRYVCKICPDVDLCNECMQRYDDGGLNQCKDHPFLRVQAPEKRYRPMQITDLIPDSVQTWLRQLILDFV